MGETIMCAECGAPLFSAAVLARSFPGITHDAGCPIAGHDAVVGAPRSKADALRHMHNGRPAYVQLVTPPESTYRPKWIAVARDLGPRRTYAKQLEEARPYRRRAIAEPWSDWDAFGWDCIACGEESEERTASHAQVRAVRHNRTRHPRRMRRT